MEKSVIIKGQSDDDGFITPDAFKVDGQEWSAEPSPELEAYLRKRGVMIDYRGTKRISKALGRTASAHRQSDGSIKVVVNM